MSFPQIFNASELEAAYRFFGNVAVTPDGVLGGHYDATRAAAAKEDSVIVVHDTSTFSFDPTGEREGLGRVRSLGQAFFGHFALVLSDDGERRPLGLAALHSWVRGEEKTDERARWLAGVERAQERLQTTSAVHVMDREADDFAFFCDLIERRQRFVIRLAHDRLLQQEQPADARTMTEAATLLEREVQRSAKLSARKDAGRSPKQKGLHPARTERTAVLSIAACEVSVKRPTTQPKTRPPEITLNMVRVWEEAPPDGQEPVEWRLLTNEPIDSVTELTRIVDRYRARWTIEEYFKALKSGCAYETRQLGDYEGLLNALAVFAPIACRMLTLRTEARLHPNEQRIRVLDDDELTVLRTLGRRKLSDSPTSREILLAVAGLGGHIKYAPDPGWLTIARGFRELETLTVGWRAAKLQPAYDQR